jgi:hypothetical protein
VNEHEQCQKWLKELMKHVKAQAPTSQESLRPADDEASESNKHHTPSKVSSALNLKAKSLLVTSMLKIDTQLHTLQIVNCHLKDATILFDSMYNHPQLVNLNLSFNNLRDMPSLSLCTGLKIVDVSHNRLQSLDFLSECTFLQVLRCHNNNNIESLFPLENYTRLEEVWLSHNKIDWMQFMHLQNNKELRILVKNNNPCDEKAKCNDFISSIIPSIQCLDGVNINDNAPSSHRFSEESIDVKVMTTQARAQLKRDQSSQNLMIDNLSIGNDNSGHDRLRSHSAKISRGHSRTTKGLDESENELHSQTPDGKLSSKQSSLKKQSSLRHLQKKHSNSTQDLQEHADEEGDVLGALAVSSHKSKLHMQPDSNKSKGKKSGIHKVGSNKT